MIKITSHKHKYAVIAISTVLVLFSETMMSKAGEVSYVYSEEEHYDDYAERVMELRRYVATLMDAEPLPINVFSDLLLDVDLTRRETVAKIRIILSEIEEQTSPGDERLLQLAPIFVEMICKRYDKAGRGISPFPSLLDAGDEALPHLKELLACPNISNSMKYFLRDRIDEIEYRTLGIENMTFP